MVDVFTTMNGSAAAFADDRARKKYD